MKLTEFIEKLEIIRAKIGDAEVLVREDGFGGYGIHRLGSISEDTLCVFDIEDNDNELNEIFPGWDGDKELTIACVEISAGGMLYST